MRYSSTGRIPSRFQLLAAGLVVVGPFHILVSNTIHEAHESRLDKRYRRHDSTAYRYPPELVVSHANTPVQHQPPSKVEIGATNRQVSALAVGVS